MAISQGAPPPRDTGELKAFVQVLDTKFADFRQQITHEVAILRDQVSSDVSEIKAAIRDYADETRQCTSNMESRIRLLEVGQAERQIQIESMQRYIEAVERRQTNHEKDVESKFKTQDDKIDKVRSSNKTLTALATAWATLVALIAAKFGW